MPGLGAGGSGPGARGSGASCQNVNKRNAESASWLKLKSVLRSASLDNGMDKFIFLYFNTNNEGCIGIYRFYYDLLDLDGDFVEILISDTFFFDVNILLFFYDECTQ